MRNLILKMASKSQVSKEKIKKSLACNRGEGFMGGAVGIIIVVVVGALIMGGIYTLFKSVIMPNVDSSVKDLFNYKG